MSRGLSQLQRSILDVLPVAGAPWEKVHPLTVEDVALQVGRSHTFEGPQTKQEWGMFRSFIAMGMYRRVPVPGEQRVDEQERFTIYRALRSLERRGLVWRGAVRENPTRWYRSR